MIPPLFRRSPKATIAALYGAIVAQARKPRFYLDYAVPDTVEGRFDMVLLHVVLVLRRLREENADQRALAQNLFDTFCRDMDHNLREMGISDQGLPKHMQRVGEAFYGRAQAYETALGEGEGAKRDLTQALVRNVYAGVAAPPAAALAAYVRQTAALLSAQQSLDAEMRFPEPAPLVAVE
jgi:cytochrome b pre-mRNA-processing protein 3